MDDNKFSEMQLIKLRIRELEDKIREKFENFTRNQQIIFDRCSDYGERFFSISLYFDDINIQALSNEHIEQIKQFLTQYKELRKSQRLLEIDLAIIESTIEKNRYRGIL